MLKSTCCSFRYFFINVENHVYLIDLDSLTIKFKIPSSKGALYMGACPCSNDSIKLAIALKHRKLLILNLSKTSVVEICNVDLSSNVCRDILWIDELRLVITLSESFVIVHVHSGVLQEIFSHSTFSLFSSIVKPAICLVQDRCLMFCKKDIMFKMDLENYMIQNNPIQWSAPPLEIFFFSPYICALLPTCIEIKSISTHELIQQINLKAKLIIPESLIISDSSSIYKLLPLDFEDQIEQLLDANDFQQAKNLINELEFPTPESKNTNLIHVRGMEAHYMFELKEYSKAIAILQELNASPIDVINLYPDFKISDTDSIINDESDVDSLIPLMDYLTRERNVLKKIRATVVGNDLVDVDYLAGIVDTTLLKVYLQVNESLAFSLLRVENFCLFEESRYILSNKPKLVIELMHGHGFYKDALEYLKLYLFFNLGFVLKLGVLLSLLGI